jgi:hypothetical protein
MLLYRSPVSTPESWSGLQSAAYAAVCDVYTARYIFRHKVRNLSTGAVPAGIVVGSSQF